jgi:hypothetical protein
VTLNPDGTFAYTPAADFNGTDTFTYTVSDEASPWHIHGLAGLLGGGGHTSTTTVTVTVTPVNDAPVAVDDGPISIAEDTPISAPAAVLAANDTDVDGDALTVTAVSNASGGTVDLTGGIVTFTPTPDYNGPASFDYTVSDGALTDTGTVTLTVTPVNDAPVAVDDGPFEIAQDTALVGPAEVLALNDTDVDGDPLTVTAVSNPSTGTVVLENGLITFTPSPGFAGDATFDYTVSDAQLSDVGTVTVTVVGNPNHAPVAVDDGPFTVAENGSRTLTAAELLGNDTDADGDVLHVAVLYTTANTHGTVVLNNDGTVTYTPDADYTGPTEFTYTVADASNTQSANTATVTLTVAPTATLWDQPLDPWSSGWCSPCNGDLPAPNYDYRTWGSFTLDNAATLTSGRFAVDEIGPPGDLNISIWDAPGGTLLQEITVTEAQYTKEPVGFGGNYWAGIDLPYWNLGAGTYYVSMFGTNDNPVAMGTNFATGDDVQLLSDGTVFTNAVNVPSNQEYYGFQLYGI